MVILLTALALATIVAGAFLIHPGAALVAAGAIVLRAVAAIGGSSV